MEYMSPRRSTSLSERIVEHIGMGTYTRQQLQGELQVSRPVLGRALAVLIQNGAIVSVPSAEEHQGRGRPPQVLKLADNVVYSVGISIGRSVCSAVMLDHRKRVLLRYKAEGVTESSRFLSVARKLIEGLRSKASRERIDTEFIACVSVALPIPVENVESLGKDAQVMTEYLSQLWHVPITIRNTVVAAGLAESRWGAGRDAASQLYLHLSGGVGSCLIVPVSPELELSYPGEIGHVTLPHLHTQCQCGKRGCVETIASIPALCQQVGVSTVAELAERHRAGDTKARESIYSVSEALGRICAAVALSVSPEMIIVGGELVHGLPEIVSLLAKAIEREKIPSSMWDCEVVPAQLAEDGPARGSILAAASAQKN